MMTPEQFVYWLQGYMEMENPKTMNKKQTQMVKDHLKLVFDKQTPDNNANSDWDIIEDQSTLFCASLDGSKKPLLPGTGKRARSSGDLSNRKVC